MVDTRLRLFLLLTRIGAIARIGALPESITADTGHSSSSEILRQFVPSARSLSTSSRRNTRRGRPSDLPLAFARRALDLPRGFNVVASGRDYSCFVCQINFRRLAGPAASITVQLLSARVSVQTATEQDQNVRAGAWVRLSEALPRRDNSLQTYRK